MKTAEELKSAASEALASLYDSRDAEEIRRELLRRLERVSAAPPPAARVCRGTLISRAQFLVDIEEWGYLDPREEPRGGMSEEEIAVWTAAIEEQ